MNIVIVESAAKAKTINKYLGSGYKVIASYGHVRDLPSKDGSVDPSADFSMVWEIEGSSGKVVSEITKAVKGADKLILATDPDREGEAISWHLLRILEEKNALKGVKVERVAFNAVTKTAIMDAMRQPRQIDEPLVDAYLARRALDYLVGFTLSPVLWRKLPGAKSAGRVQSVALRLVCDRETEIEAFKTREYWTVAASLKTVASEEVLARLVAAGGKKLDKFSIENQEAAYKIRDAVTGQPFTVVSVEAKDQKRHPWPPFTTSTLQQEASRKLGFSARQTMQVAQKLYEGVDIGGETAGLITYMRTDGVQIVPEAIAQCRGVIGKTFGDRYVPKAPRDYKTKAKNAQEAHEAIRPTDFNRAPDDVRRYLKQDELALYKLIWKRAVASQMASADFERTTVEIEVKGRDGAAYGFRATGSVVLFDGFLKLYVEGRDDDGDEEDARLPKLGKGDGLKPVSVEAAQHFTEPPPRYTEATLIRRMEELGIGRPSTYASTLAVLHDRQYVTPDKKRLIPEDKGRLVTAFLQSFFQRYVEYDFTAGLEEKLDLISDGKLAWKDVLRDFWRDFLAAVNQTKELRVGEVLEALNEILGPHIFPAREDGGDPRQCPSCGAGTLSLKTGKFGAFVGCSNYPECRFTRQFKKSGEDAPETPVAEKAVLGIDPDTGQEVTLRNGRFGPYVQLGEAVDKKDKPKRASIPKGTDPAGLDLKTALQLLSLPRVVGNHPETGKPITAGFGRFGPFLEHEGKYRKLPAEEVLTVGLNRAVSLLAEASPGGQRRGAEVLKDLGEHPELKGKIEVLSGRYGPYVKHGKINATLPKGAEPATLTVEAAVELLAAKAAKAPSKPVRGKAKAAPKAASEAPAGKPAKVAVKKAAKASKPAGKSGKAKAAVKAAE